MEKQERLEIIYKIGDVIEKHCRACEFNGKNRNLKECVKCPTGKKLKRLGNKLDQFKRNPVPAHKERWPATYQRAEVNKKRKEIHDKMRAEGKTVEQIAVELDMNYNTLLYHRKKWRKEGAVL